jgi:hypothetical protein
MTVKQKYVLYINEQIKVGCYLPQDIINIDEAHSNVDQSLGETLADRWDKMIGCTVTGSENLCDVLLACTISGEKLPPYIIFKGKHTRVSHARKDFSTKENISEHGYP